MQHAKFILFILLLASFFIRVVRLSEPPGYVFDEVYHAWTAAAYAKNDPRGYEWWHHSPREGTAYEWLHPPVAKLFQAVGILAFGDTAIGWRFFSVVVGTGSILLVYLLGRTLFSSDKIGLLAATFFAFDPLAFVQSRIAMNDIFVVFFLLFSVLLLFFRRYFWMSLVFGLAISTKWSSLFVLPIILIFTLFLTRKTFWRKQFALFLLIPIVYLFSYTQFWLQGHTWQQFVELHRQTWWYQTNLTATHDYSSPAWSWPLALRPVWYFVDYGQRTVAHIYAMGNPISWWFGLIGVGALSWSVLTGGIRPFRLVVIFLLSAYGILWLPWIFAPRIMFLYHYLLAIPFLYLSLSFFLTRFFPSHAVAAVLLLHLSFFVLFYPHIAAVSVPVELDQWYYLLPSWR